MANYSLVINSQFHPISYQEMIDPVVRTQQAQDALEDRYSELQANANIWNGYVDEQRDKRAYAQLHNYSSQLRQASDALYKSGMNASSKRTLMNLLGRYSSEIKPIENAYKARAEEIKEQRAGELSGVMYETDANTKSLDDYLANPEGRSKQASYKESYTRIASAMKNLKNQLSGYGLGKPVDHYTNTFLKSHGITPQNAAAAIGAVRDVLSGKQNDWGNNILTDLFKGEMDAQGVSGWADKNKQMQFFNKIAPAVYEGIGAQDVTPMTNQAAMQAAENARLRYRLNHQGGGNNSEKYVLPDGSVIPIGTPRGIYTSRDKMPANAYVGIKGENGKYNGAQQYFYKDPNTGDIRLNKAGQDAVRGKHFGWYINTAKRASEGNSEARKALKNFAEKTPSEANLFAFAIGNRISKNDLLRGSGASMNAAVNAASKNIGDLLESGEEYLAVDQSGLGQMDAHMKGLRGGTVKTINIKNEGGKPVYKTSNMKLTDLAGYKLAGANIVVPRTQGAPAYYDLTYSKDGEDEPKIVRVPVSEIDSRANKFVNANMAEVQKYSQILDTMNDNKTNELYVGGTKYTRREIENAINTHMNSALQMAETGIRTTKNAQNNLQYDLYPQLQGFPKYKTAYPKAKVYGEDNEE